MLKQKMKTKVKTWLLQGSMLIAIKRPRWKIIRMENLKASRQNRESPSFAGGRSSDFVTRENRALLIVKERITTWLNAPIVEIAIVAKERSRMNLKSIRRITQGVGVNCIEGTSNLRNDTTSALLELVVPFCRDENV
mmetsp:Transcript_19858/g.41408  ORF Transcript_19858/g.41408 Transcript_19858/m.41408 type:complete len:137 (-) Transcript_19858:245-655(-)